LRKRQPEFPDGSLRPVGDGNIYIPNAYEYQTILKKHLCVKQGRCMGTVSVVASTHRLRGLCADEKEFLVSR